MERKEAEERIRELSRELEEHNHRYYVLAQPIISLSLIHISEPTRPY